MPASSKTRAVIASYAVTIGHFSPRSFAAAMSRTVTRRVALPPYSVVDRPDVVTVAETEAEEEAVTDDIVRTSKPRGAPVASPDVSDDCTVVPHSTPPPRFVAVRMSRPRRTSRPAAGTRG